MGGFLGIGGSGSQTDRGQNLGATQGAWSIFNYGMPTGEAMQTAGAQNLQTSADYWRRLLTGGRSDIAQLSAPSINAAVEGETAGRNAAAQFGSGRSGGTVAAQREAGTQTQQQINDIINQNLVAGRTAGAQGLQQIGGMQLQNALQNLGLSDDAIQQIMANSQRNYQFDVQQEAGLGSAIGNAVGGWFGL